MLLVAAGLTVVAELEVVFSDPVDYTWVLAVFVPAYTFPVAAGRLHPMAPLLTPLGIAATVVTAVALYEPGAGDPEPTFTAFLSLLVATTLVGLAADRRGVVAAAAVIVACVISVDALDSGGFGGDSFFVVLFAFLALAAGAALGHRERRAEELAARAASLDREGAARARQAVTDERARIARELHDVVAHSVSVMTVQAGAARLLLTGGRPADAREPLLAIEETGREALSEMRRVFGILRSDMSGHPDLEPRASLTRLDGLVEQARAAGLPVQLSIEGAPDVLSPGVDGTAYRVLQEALTNARKHAGPVPTRVTVRYGAHAVELRVENGPGGAGVGGHCAGQGLLGMRERISLYGGRLDAGPTGDGGFLVAAHIPKEASE